MLKTFSGYDVGTKELTLPFDYGKYNVIEKSYPFGDDTTYIPTEYKGYNANRYATNLQPVSIPKYYTPNLCKFIGYFVANGAYGGNYISFCSNNTKIGEDFINISEKLFGVKVLRVDYEGKVTSYRLSSVVVKDFLVSCIFKGQHTARFKIIPEGVLKSNQECITSFLIGLLDCDSYLERGRNFIFNSASENVAKNVHRLLLGYGVISNLRPFSGVKGYEDHTYWDVAVTGKYIYPLYENLFSDISLVYKEKPERKKVNTNFDFIPNMNLWLLSQISEIRTGLGVNAAGMYRDSNGVAKRFKVSNSCKPEIRKEITYEFLRKTLLGWEDLPEDQESLIKPVKDVLEDLNKKDYYFDKILT